LVRIGFQIDMSRPTEIESGHNDGKERCNEERGTPQGAKEESNVGTEGDEVSVGKIGKVQDSVGHGKTDRREGDYTSQDYPIDHHLLYRHLKFP